MNALSVIRVALKRLWNNKGLTFCAIVGLVVAVALISSVPLYTDAANFKVLEEQLERGSTDRRYPPFAFMYRYIGAWHGAIEWPDYQSVNEYITRSVPGVINLPVELTTRYVRTDNFSLFPASEAAYIGLRQPLGWVNLAFIENIQDHIHIVEGEYPASATGDAEVFEVLVSHAFAVKTGLQVGEEYVTFMRGGSGGADARPSQFLVRVSGVWAPQDEDDPFWFYSPRSLESSLMVTPETFSLRIAPSMRDEVYAAIWYIVFDGQNVRTDDVPNLLGRMTFANTHVSRLLPNTVLDVSPMDALQTYRWTTFVMTIVLYVFSVPILGLVLYFIGVISGLIVMRQRVEVAILKSRGAGDLQVLGIYALEGVLIGIVGLGLGLLMGRWLALIMGNTISFLSFGERVPLPVLMTPRAIRLGLLGVGIALLASLLPAMQAARLTIVTYKQDRARSMERPFWQRYFLDFILLIPVGYGYYVLNNRGTIGFLGDGTGDPFQDPLLFLVPSLAIIALSL
jgi:putative ABC transport system permease protein